MKNLLFAFFLFIATNATAQNKHFNNDAFEARKVSWLTTKLDLSTEDAKIFWPIYNDYVREQKIARKERNQKMISFRKIKEIEELDDEEIQTLIVNDFNARQRDLSIERKYYNRFKAELPIKIVGKFYRAQETFKKELLQQYRKTIQEPN